MEAGGRAGLVLGGPGVRKSEGGRGGTQVRLCYLPFWTKRLQAVLLFSSYYIYVPFTLK